MLTTKFPWRWARCLHSLDAMIAESIQVRAICTACNFFADLDLEKVRAAKGGNFCLINRRSRCRTPACGQWVRFFYLLGVYRGMWDYEVSGTRW